MLMILAIKRIVGAMLASVVLVTQATWAEPVRMQLLAEDNPPFNYVSEAGRLEGPSVEVVDAVMKAAGLEYDLSVLPWRRAFARAHEEPNTCLFSMNRTAAREKQFKWVGPLFPGGGLAFYLRAGDDRVIRSEADLKGHVIISKDAYSVFKDLSAINTLAVTKAPGEHEAYELFAAGRGDYWLTGVLSARQVLKVGGRKDTVKRAFYWKEASLALACSLSTSDAVMAALVKANMAIADKRADIIDRHF